MSTMEEKENHVKKNKGESLKACMDMRIIGLNFGLSIVLFIFVLKDLLGFK